MEDDVQWAIDKVDALLRLLHLQAADQLEAAARELRGQA